MKRLTELESIIEANQRNFYANGKALKTIRDQGLYQMAGFDTFSEYAKKRWDMGKSQAYRLIEAAEVLDNLSPIGEILPENEAQARILTPLKPITQRQVWTEFIESGMELSARSIRQFIKPACTKEASAWIERISADYKAAVMALLYQVRVAQNENWESTSRETALYWNKVMKEKIICQF